MNEPVELDWPKASVDDIRRLDHIHDLYGACRKNRSGVRCAP